MHSECTGISWYTEDLQRRLFQFSVFLFTFDDGEDERGETASISVIMTRNYFFFLNWLALLVL